jgi:hypothetical protein
VAHACVILATWKDHGSRPAWEDQKKIDLISNKYGGTHLSSQEMQEAVIGRLTVPGQTRQIKICETQCQQQKNWTWWYIPVIPAMAGNKIESPSRVRWQKSETTPHISKVTRAKRTGGPFQKCFNVCK